MFVCSPSERSPWNVEDQVMVFLLSPPKHVNAHFLSGCTGSQSESMVCNIKWRSSYACQFCQHCFAIDDAHLIDVSLTAWTWLESTERNTHIHSILCLPPSTYFNTRLIVQSRYPTIDLERKKAVEIKENKKYSQSYTVVLVFLSSWRQKKCPTTK